MKKFAIDVNLFSEPEAYVPISLVDPDKCEIILAGDPLQLSPIVLSNHAKDRGLTYSMLERYIELYGKIKTAAMVSVNRGVFFFFPLFPFFLLQYSYHYDCNNYRKMTMTLIHDW